MVFPTINNPKTTVFNQFGGDVMNLIQRLFSAINIALVDSTNKPTIDTDFRFRSGRFILQDYDYSNQIKFITPDLNVDVNVTFPLSLSHTQANEFVFAETIQTLKNKAINAQINAITNIANENIATAAAIAWNKISKTGASFGDFSTVNLTGLMHNHSIKWDSVSAKWITYDIMAQLGETNTMSNLAGTAGSVGLYKQKVGTNFEIKKVNSTHPSLTITDDVNNNEVDFGIADATTAIKGLVQLAALGIATAGLVVQANDPRLNNDRTPINHAIRHMANGIDQIKVNELGAPTQNITTTNTTITANGLAPILPNNANMFLNGVGGWSEPIGTASGVSGTGSVIRNIATRTGDGIQKTFTIAHGMSVIPTSFFVEPLTVDALGFFTKTVDATNIIITYVMAPPSTNGANNLKFSWVVFDSGTGSTMGEANTYSSVGTGVPVTKTKVGIDFPFRSLFAGSTRISIVENPNDVSFDVNQANLLIAWSQLTGVPSALVRTDQTNIFAEHLQTVRSSMLKMMNPANTFGITIAAAAVGADRIATIPLMTANDDFVMRTVQQTLTNKTLTAPIIDSITRGSFLFAMPTLSANDQAIGRNTQDTMTNKTLTNPIIAAIANGAYLLSVPTLAANDTILGVSSEQTPTNKTINLTNNTVTDTAAAAGAIPIHNGTKFLKLDKGADGSFLGVQSGSVGYFTPPTGSGGLLPSGDVVPSTGRWGAMWGGNISGDGILGLTLSAASTTYEIISPTESQTSINTAAADDAIAELKSGAIVSRQSNILFKAKWVSKQTSNCVIRIGLSSQSALAVGGSHDSPLNNASGVLVTWVSDIETNYRVVRNGGATTGTDQTTAIAANNLTAHTCEINLNNTNLTVKIDGTTILNAVTTAIPALATPLFIYAHIESIGSAAKGLGVRWEQVTCL